MYVGFVRRTWIIFSWRINMRLSFIFYIASYSPKQIIIKNSYTHKHIVFITWKKKGDCTARRPNAQRSNKRSAFERSFLVFDKSFKTDRGVPVKAPSA